MKEIFTSGTFIKMKTPERYIENEKNYTKKVTHQKLSKKLKTTVGK